MAGISFSVGAGCLLAWLEWRLVVPTLGRAPRSVPHWRVIVAIGLVFLGWIAFAYVRQFPLRLTPRLSAWSMLALGLPQLCLLPLLKAALKGHMTPALRVLVGWPVHAFHHGLAAALVLCGLASMFLARGANLAPGLVAGAVASGAGGVMLLAPVVQRRV